MDQAPLPRIVMLGPPGAGKDTQGKMLAKNDFGVPHISSGELLRAIAATDTPLGRRIVPVMQTTKYASDEDTDSAVYSRLGQPDCVVGWVLNGYPRRDTQVRTLDALCPPALAILLKLSDDQATKRLRGRWGCEFGHLYNLNMFWPADGLCVYCHSPLTQRDDDTTLEGICDRLREYRRITERIAELYRHPAKNKNRLLEIDAGQPIAAVRKNILSHLTTNHWIDPSAFFRSRSF